MKAIAPRIEHLYESEVKQWRAAWQRFIDAVLEVLTNDELEVFVEIDNDGSAFNSAYKVVLASIFPAASRPAWEAWMTDGWEPDFDRPDLSKWPDLLPRPPDEAPGVWEALREMVRTYKAQPGEAGDMHRAQAASFLLLALSSARQARTYR